MKKVFSMIVMIALTGALLIGCGSGKQSEASESPQQGTQSESSATASQAASNDKPAVIHVFHYMLQNTKQEGLRKLQEEYTKRHPNVTFKNTFYNQGTDYFPQLSTALASGEAPEIIMGNPGLYPDVVSNGFAMDLTDNETINSMNFSKGELGDVSANGKVYAFPIDFKTWGVFYNVKVFEELGISVPKTQSELLAAAQKIADAGIDPWIHAFGDAVFGDIEMRNSVWTRAFENGDLDFFEKLMSGESKFADYPYVLEALNTWQQRMQWHRPDAMANDQNKALELFVAGEGAMMYNGSWSIGDLIAKADDDFKFGFFLAPVDDDPESTLMNLQIDQSFMVNPKAKHVDAALDFMKFWMTDGALIWSNESMMPLTTGQTSDQLPASVRDIIDIKNSGKIVGYGDFTMPFSAEATTKWRQVLTEFAESNMTGGSMTPEKAIEFLQRAFDDMIATSK